MYSPSPPLRPRSGFGGATTVTSSPSSSSYRPRKPDASANAPWTRTMVESATSNHLTPIGYTINAHLVTPWPAPGDLVHANNSLRRCLGRRGMGWSVLIPETETATELPQNCHTIATDG